MTKFHVSDDGNPRPCAAQKGNCPIGGETEHFTNPESAREHYESTQGSAVKSIKRVTSETRMATLPEIKNVEYEKDEFGEGVSEEGVAYTTADTYRTGRNGSRTRLATVTVYDDGTALVWDKSGSTISDVKALDKLKVELKKTHKISKYSSPIFVNDF